MTTNIYGLICPLTHQMMYIGKANNPERRLRDHMCDYRGVEYNKVLWIRKLKHMGLKPILQVLDVISIDEWQWWEQWWIEYFKYLGVNLVNRHIGGNGLSVADEHSFKPGNKRGKQR